MISVIHNERHRGFTLIELLMVIAIIGILATVVLMSLESARQKGRDAQRISQTQEVMKALELYYSNNGAYPTSSGPDGFEGLNDITEITSGGYMSHIPQDPIYEYNGSDDSYRYCSTNGNYYVLFVNVESDGLGGSDENTHCYIERNTAAGSCASQLTGKVSCATLF